MMNAVVGNAGLGTQVDDIREQARVTAHLEFALDHLESSESNISAGNVSLISLSEYVQIGVFPRHEDPTAPQDRKPCFIDSLGTPCAVAYLMRASGHSSLADKIAANYKHSTIEEIVDGNLKEEFLEWQKLSGLTVAELALIQPTYEFEQADKARFRFVAILKRLDEVAISIRKGDASDVNDDVSIELQEEIRKFAITFRNGNIGEHDGGARSRKDVKIGRFGWTAEDMEQFQMRMHGFESTLPSEGCVKLRLLIEKLRHAATGKRNNAYSLDVSDGSECGKLDRWPKEELN